MMESINVVVDDDEVQRPINMEEKQLNSAEPSTTPTDIINPASKESPDESPYLDTTPTTSEDEDTRANPPKQSRVKQNHPPQQLLGNIDEGHRLRSRVIQPTSEVANQVSFSCYLAQQERFLRGHFGKSVRTIFRPDGPCPPSGRCLGIFYLTLI
jgi:hypothetical protein